MDLPGDPLPFLQHARLAGLGEQLGCSPVFSAIISSSRRLAPASSAIIRLRAWFCSSAFAPGR